MVVQGTANQEVPITKREKVPPPRHLSTVLGQCRRNLRTEQSWDSTVLGQWSWDRVLGQGLGTRSWDKVLGQGSRDRILGQ